MNQLETLIKELDLDEIARKHAQQITPMLLELDTDVADIGTIESYLTLYSLSKRAKAELDNAPLAENGKRNPCFDIFINSTKELKQISNQLGLNVKSRLTLKNLSAEKEDESIDPLL
ncbi:P27 family phage terminase small subunit [Kurthia massiliensis]|uniref:P27 family phage terminase small subunit n=1 Tax=Kurthia massiliensis TaxID=1033739 RepID=UPI000289C707|nr:P27 family phage terminase small subunit [Kurthia massiliensis]